MLKELNIALFADADNCGLEYSHFDNTLFQLNEMGNVVYGKIYGVSDRKHKEIINDINKFGFDMAPVMRVKKRGSKVFDNRILIDVMDEVLSNSNIDAVCIVAAKADMVPLYSRLHKLGVKIVALDNVDDESLAFVDEVLDIGLVDVIKLPKPSSHRSAPTAAPEQAAETSLVEAKAEEQRVEEVSVKPEQSEPVAEVSDDLQEAQTAQSVVSAKADEDVEILKQIEEVKAQQTPVSNDDEQLLDEIKKLLEEFNTEND